MLKQIIELQKRAVQQLIDVIKVKDEVTFRAPTGSGKTFMMADFMNQILSQNNDIIFLVSTLSKGNLAEQNNEKFCEYASTGKFPFLDTYLISSETSSEEEPYIPPTHNVYILPRDLYKDGSRLKQGAMEHFLNTMTLNKHFSGFEKNIYLIKDECHIATSNLDNISSYFEKIINFSATPKLKRGQIPDVEITDDEAVEAQLIKRIELGDENDDVEVAINKFREIKKEYRNNLYINPCLIIQISNKEIAERELNKLIPLLNEKQDLNWMLIVDKEKECKTNEAFEKKGLPVKEWKKYAKQPNSTIDVIIFKMVISEGWDIPRACMLYQIRKTKSEQLDEQVIGRVRRNPRLLDFENLNEDAKKLALTSWIWGNQPEKRKRRS